MGCAEITNYELRITNFRRAESNQACSDCRGEDGNTQSNYEIATQKKIVSRISYLVIVGLSSFFILISSFASAQQITLNRSEIPCVPVDTLPVERGMRVVIYSDNTFRTILAEPEKLWRTDVYGKYFDTVNLFAYRRLALEDLPSSVWLDLTDKQKNGYHRPAEGWVISHYGPRGRRNHQGVDIVLKHGQPVHAAFDGVVRWSRWNSGGYGNLVIVRHASGLETYYAHLSRRNVVAGDVVRAGQVVGYGGRTGRAFGLHLHFETRYCDQSFDPERMIDFKTGQLREPRFYLRRAYFAADSRASEGIETDDEILSADSLAAAQHTDTLAVTPKAATDTPASKPASKPASRPKSQQAVYHTVKSGDTLLGIALKYGTKLDAVCRLNGISSTTTLHIGRRLRVK